MITSLTVNPNSNDSFKNSNMNALTNNNLWAFFHIEKVERSRKRTFPKPELRVCRIPNKISAKVRPLLLKSKE